MKIRCLATNCPTKGFFVNMYDLTVVCQACGTAFPITTVHSIIEYEKNCDSNRKKLASYFRLRLWLPFFLLCIAWVAALVKVPNAMDNLIIWLVVILVFSVLLAVVVTFMGYKLFPYPKHPQEVNS